MDSGPAHPSRLLPTWTMILPNSGKPEFGDASRNDGIASQIQDASATRFPARPHPVIASPRVSAKPRPMKLAQHRHLDHVIGIANVALEHGVLEFKVEAARRAAAAPGRQSTAEHRAA